MISNSVVIIIQFKTLLCKVVECCKLWARHRAGFMYALFDPSSSGFIGILPDWTVRLLRLKCVIVGLSLRG